MAESDETRLDDGTCSYIGSRWHERKRDRRCPRLYQSPIPRCPTEHFLSAFIQNSQAIGVLWQI